MSKRIQRKRTKGWKKPPDAVIVDRTSRWGNPYHVSERDDAASVVKLFRRHMINVKRLMPRRYRDMLEPLRGKDLCCWCDLNQPCHADVLLELVAELEPQP